MVTLISGVMELDTCKKYLEFKLAVKEFKVVCILDFDNKNGFLLHVGKEGIGEVLDKYKKFKIIEFFHDYNEMVIEAY